MSAWNWENSKEMSFTLKKIRFFPEKNDFKRGLSDEALTIVYSRSTGCIKKFGLGIFLI